MYHLDGPTTHRSSKAMTLKMALAVGMEHEQKEYFKDETPIAWVLLLGQLTVTSSIWTPPTPRKHNLLYGVKKTFSTYQKCIIDSSHGKETLPEHLGSGQNDFLSQTQTPNTLVRLGSSLLGSHDGSLLHGSGATMTLELKSLLQRCQRPTRNSSDSPSPAFYTLSSCCHPVYLLSLACGERKHHSSPRLPGGLLNKHVWMNENLVWCHQRED